MGYSVIDDEPNPRFPVYTRGNAGEVFPNVMTPMTGSLIGTASTEGQTRALRRLGMLAESDLAGPGKIGTGVFGGYLYANLSMVRVACDRIPGLSAADADRQMAGVTDEAPLHHSHPDDRDWRTSVRGLRAVARAIWRPDISEVDQARVGTDRWRSALPAPSSLSDEELVAFVRSYPPRFARGMELLLTYSGKAGAAAAVTEQLAERADSSPGSVQAISAGLGTIDSAQPAFRLWRLGRDVAASPDLTRVFDARDTDGLHVSDHPDAVEFRRGFAEFLAIHGARGPDEWELASDTWATDPTIALAAIERLRHAPDERDPVVVGQRLAAERERRRADIRARLAPPVRPVFDRVVHATALHAAGPERAKAVFVDDLYPVRCALFELGHRVAARHGSATDRDVFLATADELADYVGRPSDFDSVIAERRHHRDWLQARIPPFVFEGRLPDPATWPLRTEVGAASASAATPTVIVGQGVCPGVARGRARIVLDPAAPGGLEPGDILVAPLTDPAWTPLFLAAAGVVVEVGAQLSHAAIVARELGIPAVVSAADATRLIADGQLIEVDGSAGTVRPVG